MAGFYLQNGNENSYQWHRLVLHSGLCFHSFYLFRSKVTTVTLAVMLFVIFILFSTLKPNSGEVFEADAFVPAVLTTWKFANATRRAWDVLIKEKGSAVDAVAAGCAVCEYEQCDFTVGYGGSPDENGETTLDAMIMDGTHMNVGAVGGLRRIKNAVGVARKVLENTKHSFLVGELATEFGRQMGFMEENLTTPHSRDMHDKWKRDNCQPNFWTRVTPDPTKRCGPYRPVTRRSSAAGREPGFGEGNHDTIGMVAVDSNLRTASGTSTNGARNKIPGRVGDSPIPGAGSYADDEIGGAAATGDGDVMMRFLPSFLAVEEMRRGRSPEKATRMAVGRIKAKHPEFRGAVVALRKDGMFGAACSGLDLFPYCVANPMTGTVKMFFAKCD